MTDLIDRGAYQVVKCQNLERKKVIIQQRMSPYNDNYVAREMRGYSDSLHKSIIITIRP